MDFLSGKAPLNLTMRLGDHMMLIQLQLSTVNSSSSSKRSRTSNPNSASISRPPSSVSSATTANSTPGQTTTMPSGQPQSNSKAEESYKPKLDTRALTEASKNLTKTLRQLSSEVLTTKCEEVSYNKDKQSVLEKILTKRPLFEMCECIELVNISQLFCSFSQTRHLTVELSQPKPK